MLRTVRVEKVDEKHEIICLVSMFCCWVIVLKLLKIWKFVLTSARNLSVKAIYMYASESSHYTLLENGIGCRGLNHG